VRLHRSVDEFRSIAEPLYRGDPVLHTIELTVLRSGSLPDDSVLITAWDNHVPIGAALQTPPYPLSCNGIPMRAVGVVAAELARVRPDLTGVRGLRDCTLAFADAWSAVTGRRGRIATEERLYWLRKLRAPNGVAGGYRFATREDRGLLVEWLDLFFSDAGGNPSAPAARQRFIDNAARVGDRFLLWSVDDSPVSMAMLRAPATGVSRIGPVFTLRARRGHGYASAVTAAAVEVAHRCGTVDVVLFADLANPVSNAIYQRIGFEPVVDSVRIDFG
jgi:GNAT superfamily N-acetyltransferase